MSNQSLMLIVSFAGIEWPVLITSEKPWPSGAKKATRIRNSGRSPVVTRNLNREPTPCPAMDPTSLVSAMIAARIGQAQIAAAARMMRQAESAQLQSVVQLLAAANASGDALAAAVQTGVGELVDISV
jgi:hypothetical protein